MIIVQVSNKNMREALDWMKVQGYEHINEDTICYDIKVGGNMIYSFFLDKVDENDAIIFRLKFGL